MIGSGIKGEGGALPDRSAIVRTAGILNPVAKTLSLSSLLGPFTLFGILLALVYASFLDRAAIAVWRRLPGPEAPTGYREPNPSTRARVRGRRDRVTPTFVVAVASATLLGVLASLVLTSASRHHRDLP